MTNPFESQAPASYYPTSTIALDGARTLNGISMPDLGPAPAVPTIPDLPTLPNAPTITAPTLPNLPTMTQGLPVRPTLAALPKMPDPNDPVLLEQQRLAAATIAGRAGRQSTFMTKPAANPGPTNIPAPPQPSQYARQTYG